MKVVSLLFCLLLFSRTGFAQNYAIFKTAVILDNTTRERGVLYDVNESEILLVADSPKLKQNLLEGKPIEIIKIPQNKIKGVAIRRKGFFFRNLLGSAIVLGGGLGLIGYASGDDKDGGWFSSAESKAALGAMVGLYGSIYVGPAISLFPKKRFHNKMSQEEAYRNRLRRFSLQYQKEHWKATE